MKKMLFIVPLFLFGSWESPNLIKTNQEIDDPMRLLQLGRENFNMERFDVALKYFKACYLIFEKTNSREKEHIAMCEVSISYCYFYLEEPDKSLEYLKKVKYEIKDKSWNYMIAKLCHFHNEFKKELKYIKLTRKYERRER
jgi:tetratricopeptide (TPR) repeat protein